jgi:hypothetical protein
MSLEAQPETNWRAHLPTHWAPTRKTAWCVCVCVYVCMEYAGWLAGWRAESLLFATGFGPLQVQAQKNLVAYVYEESCARSLASFIALTRSWTAVIRPARCLCRKWVVSWLPPALRYPRPPSFPLSGDRCTTAYPRPLARARPAVGPAPILADERHTCCISNARGGG